MAWTVKRIQEGDYGCEERTEEERNAIFDAASAGVLEAYAEKLHFSSEENSETFRTVMRLPRKYRMVIYLHYYEGYSTAEIAQILGSKQSTVCTQLERGRKLLKNMLLEANDD